MKAMNFVLIDCDTSYFTQPGDLLAAFGPLWGKIPIHLGMVPFHKAEGVYISPGEKSQDRFPLVQNQELYQFLCEKLDQKEIGIVQHGFDHAPVEGRGEFSCPERASKRLGPGRKALESWFQIPVRVFLPPNGQLCSRGMSLLRQQGMDIVGRFSFDPRKGERDFTLNTPFEWARRTFFLRRHVNLPYPWLLRSGGIFELDCMWLMPDDRLDSLYPILKQIGKIGGTVCIGTHYWELQKYPKSQKALFDLVEALQSRGDTRFPRLEEVFHRKGPSHPVVHGVG